MPDPFDVVPPYSWDNPKDVRILEYVRKHQGEEAARRMTLPNEEYMREVCRLMALNDHNDDSVPEYGQEIQS